MPDPAIQQAKRRQALGIGLFLVALTLGLSALYHLVRSDAVAYRRGENAFARGDYTAAADYFIQAQAGGIRSGNLDRHLAIALLKTDRQSEALDLLLNVLAAKPRNPELRAIAIGIAQSLDRPEDGLKIYAALGPAEKLPLADLVRLADLNQQAGHLEQAVVCIKLALERAPDSPELHVLQGQYLARLGRYDEAVAELRLALKFSPQSQPAQLALARALAWSQNYPAAIAAYHTYLGQ